MFGSVVNPQFYKIPKQCLNEHERALKLEKSVKRDNIRFFGFANVLRP